MTNIIMKRDKITEEMIFKANNWSEKDLAFFNQIKFPDETPESIRNSTSYYLEKFHLYEQGKKYLGWNWPAFLWVFYWGNYRKLYSLYFMAILFDLFKILLILLSVKIIENFVFNEKLVYFSYSLVFIILIFTHRIIFGYYANLFYVKKIIRKIKQGSTSCKPSIWMIMTPTIILILIGWIIKITLGY